uniref:Uncharacterized protein n=1 Tax=Musca domestica TaxID=7370 RepID=T1PHB4_MUSDO
MDFHKLSLLLMSFILTLTTFTSARHHFPVQDGPLEYSGNERMQHHSRKFHSQQSDVPGYPMMGPPSPPFIMHPMHGKGHGGMGGGPGVGNSRPNHPVFGQNFAPPQHNAAPQYPLRNNNFPTNVNPSQYPVPAFNNNPQQGGFVPRPPQPSLPNREVYSSNTYATEVNGNQLEIPNANLRGGQGPHQHQAYTAEEIYNINNLPAVQTVTNELSLNEKTTVKPTVNPRTFDLLSGSNIYEEKTTGESSVAPKSKTSATEPDDFGIRLLLDGARQCKENEILFRDTCRPKV